MKYLQFGALALLPLACAPASGDGDPAGTGGSLSTGGAVSGGSSPVSTGGTLLGTGGSASGGVASVGGVGPVPSGGAPTGGGGASAGGAAAGGAAVTGGTESTGGAAAGGSIGVDPGIEATQDLVGLRIDDACAGTPAVSVGATCDHAERDGAGYHGTNEVQLGGEQGQVYDVTLRVRGVVEPTNILGGTREDSGTFSYMNMQWRNVPVTVGGSVAPDDSDYAQWSIRVSEPAGQYFLNDYQRVGHYVFLLDYELTIPMAANATVTLEGIDANERLILNYENYAPEGIAGSVNHGQFVELDVVSAVQQ